MARPKIFDLTDAQKRVGHVIADFVRQERPALVGDLVHALKLAGESSLTPTLQKMQRNGFIQIHRSGVRGRFRVVELTEKGRRNFGLGGVPLLGSIPAGPISEAVAHPVEWVDPGSFLSPAPQDFFLRVHGDSMVGDGILDGDLALLRPHVKVPHGSIAAACVGEEREATLKRIYYEGEQIRFKASNPLYKDILAPAESVSFAGLLKGVMRRVGER